MTLNQVEINRFKVSHGSIVLEKDCIAIEEPLQISLSQNNVQQIYSLTMRTPGDDVALVYGLLFSEGVISKAEDILSTQLTEIKGEMQSNCLIVELSTDLTLNLANKQRRHASYSGCGLCGKTSLQALELKSSRVSKKITGKLELKLVKSLKQWLAKQPLFSQTGGSHVAAFIYQTNGRFEMQSSPFFEDVGRHNALDKLIGHELIENNLQQNGILILSGRIGFELVQKAVMAGISMIVALGAPSSLAIQAAKQFDVTLVGFAKENSFNCYTHYQ